MPSGVEFDEDSLTSSYRRPGAPGRPSVGGVYQRPPQGGMTGWLIRKGWVKSNGTAQVVLIVIVIINVVATYVLIKFFL
jgi:hypothetical protein